MKKNKSYEHIKLSPRTNDHHIEDIVGNICGNKNVQKAAIAGLTVSGLAGAWALRKKITKKLSNEAKKIVSSGIKDAAKSIIKRK